MTKLLATQQTPTLDELLGGMKEKAEELLRKFFVGKTLDGEPWAEEHFEVTMQVLVDVTIANTDITNFNIHTSIQDHMLLMTVENKGNTVADVVYLVTTLDNPSRYQIDDVQVAFKPGAFVAPKEEIAEEVVDALPFD